MYDDRLVSFVDLFFSILHSSWYKAFEKGCLFAWDDLCKTTPSNPYTSDRHLLYSLVKTQLSQSAVSVDPSCIAVKPSTSLFAC